MDKREPAALIVAIKYVTRAILDFIKDQADIFSHNAKKN
jgi:hypothetical protein